MQQRGLANETILRLQDLPVVGPVSGPLAGLAWRAYETSAQISWKTLSLQTCCEKIWSPRAQGKQAISGESNQLGPSAHPCSQEPCPGGFGLGEDQGLWPLGVQHLDLPKHIHQRQIDVELC